MIIATMTELAQRMLTKRPTVARTSEIGIWLAARSPTRASDPRTEITRPKDVTMNEPGKSEGFAPDYARPRLHKRLNGSRGGFVKSAAIRPTGWFLMHTRGRKRPKNAPLWGRQALNRIKEDFTIRAVRRCSGVVLLTRGAPFGLRCKG
ncbi:hypothetical protein [Bradyrhizobium niftali]|uniref:hypothetical protein n=1 Tax=Bradyrhizobium niftali TaxID=2560055 RepID=UPI001F3251E7|nr:hypothetical protein [Bradyrhizobium niftali]